MDRAARLYAITEELRSAGERGRSAGWLADRFEVSERTIKRDMLALQDAGLPVWSATGPGGGYRLLTSGGSLPPVTFTEGEAAAIAIALAMQRDSPFAAEGRAALTKLARLLPDEQRGRADALAGRVWLRGGRARARHARVLDEAIRTGRVVKIDYRDSAGQVTRARLVEPLAFAENSGDWYLLAWCRLRESGRAFLLDRVQRAVLTKEEAPERIIGEVIGDIPPDAIQATLGDVLEWSTH